VIKNYHTGGNAPQILDSDDFFAPGNLQLFPRELEHQYGECVNRRTIQERAAAGIVQHVEAGAAVNASTESATSRLPSIEVTPNRSR